MSTKKYFNPGKQERISLFLQHAGWIPEVYPCAEGAEIIVFRRDGLEVELFPDFVRVTEERKGVFLTTSFPYWQVMADDGAINGKDEDFRTAFRVEVV
jgi:hypothetical protein